MKTLFFIFCCIFSAASVHAQHVCNSFMPASTPDSQLSDNGDGTVTDNKTGLMWKKCLEGLSGDNCDIGEAASFAWQQALQQPIEVNDTGGFAGHSDWRLPNIRELRSIVEEQCDAPAINLNRFPNTLNSVVWSGSPYNGDWGRGSAWSVNFSSGFSYSNGRGSSYTVRLVRGGQ